jgi:hypothetical protein
MPFQAMLGRLTCALVCCHRSLWRLGGMRDVSELYDAFLIDQWGGKKVADPQFKKVPSSPNNVCPLHSVLHDGRHAYPGAVECFDELARAGKRLILLSNSSKRKVASSRWGAWGGIAKGTIAAHKMTWCCIQDAVLQQRPRTICASLRVPPCLLVVNDPLTTAGHQGRWVLTPLNVLT